MDGKRWKETKREEGVAGESNIERSDCTSSKDILLFNTAPNPGQMAMSWGHRGVTRMGICVEHLCV